MVWIWSIDGTKRCRHVHDKQSQRNVTSMWPNVLSSYFDFRSLFSMMSVDLAGAWTNFSGHDHHSRHQSRHNLSRAHTDGLTSFSSAIHSLPVAAPSLNVCFTISIFTQRHYLACYKRIFTTIVTTCRIGHARACPCYSRVCRTVPPAKRRTTASILSSA